MQVIEAARPRFDYVWEQSAASVAAMKNVVNLTIILSGLTSAYRLMEDLVGLQMQKMWGGGVVTEILAEVLQLTVLGLVVSAVLYALAIFFEGVLKRRKAAWNLFVAETESPRKAS
jgi:hypothetical protein